jgi:hypothetical protein
MRPTPFHSYSFLIEENPVMVELHGKRWVHPQGLWHRSPADLNASKYLCDWHCHRFYSTFSAAL